MDVHVLLWADRAVLGVVFVCTGVWKLRNRAEYRTALAELAPWPALRKVWLIILLSEIGCAMAVVLPGTLGRGGGLLALALLTAFTLSLLLAKEVADCGCWVESALARDGKAHRSTLLARNMILLALALPAALIAADVQTMPMLFGLMAGLPIALVLLDLPQFIAVVHSSRVPTTITDRTLKIHRV